MKMSFQVMATLALASFAGLAPAQTAPQGEAMDPDTVFKGKMGGTFGKNIIN